jgi:hypothetical protein
MNKRLVSFHLSEVQEQLQEILEEISKDPDYDYGEYVVSMQHLYHHLNTAWNARDVLDEEAEPGSDELFKRWGQFPRDLLPLVDV